MGRVLVTGAKGQLGRELQDVAPKEGFLFVDRKSLDITDAEAVEAFVHTHAIDTIINCAAYTAVDKAEEEPEAAYAVNHTAVRNLAEIVAKRGVKLVHISTDYVFDGKGYRPYKEEDATAPTALYGKSKLAGEAALLEVAPKNSVIIRTSWVYSGYGNNFVKSMLRLGAQREELGVVYDQVGTPTYAADLAEVILAILPKIENEKPQIYHYANEGVISWYDFAKEIMKMGKRNAKVNPIESWQYPTPARRPHYSVLNKAKIKNDFGLEIPYWKDSLDRCLQKMGERR